MLRQAVISDRPFLSILSGLLGGYAGHNESAEALSGMPASHSSIHSLARVSYGYREDRGGGRTGAAGRVKSRCTKSSRGALQASSSVDVDHRDALVSPVLSCLRATSRRDVLSMERGLHAVSSAPSSECSQGAVPISLKAAKVGLDTKRVRERERERERGLSESRDQTSQSARKEHVNQGANANGY